MSMLEHVYTGALHIVRPFLPLLAGGEGKLARGIRGREGAPARLILWGERVRDPARPTVWFHAPSVGEGLQARPVMEVLQRERPDVQLVYTYFSPSAEPFARRLPAEIAEYLPLDLPAPMAAVVHALRPDAIVFSKTEIWPNLSRIAERSGIPLLLLSATLPESSSRLRAPARQLLRPAHSRLHRLGAISASDAERFRRLGVPGSRIRIMGDARFDQVVQRAALVDRGREPLRTLLAPERITLLAGSTWPEDEAELIPAFQARRAAEPSLRLIVVPHEPTEAHLLPLEARIRAAGLGSRRLSQGIASGDEILIVDRVGLLGELYAIADLAYVGGGFGTAGLHSILEPAAFALPVLFGPRHANAREATELIAAGGGFSVGGGEELLGRLGALARDPLARSRAGGAARTYVWSGIGAAEQGAELIQEALTPDPRPALDRR